MAYAYARFDGIDKMIKKLNVGAAGLARQTAEGLYAELKEVEVPEVRRRTPIRYGDLRESVTVTDPIIKKGRWIQCNVTAGGPTAPYAVYVHEDLLAWHEVGEAKFLERPLREAAPFLAGRVARRISLKEAFAG